MTELRMDCTRLIFAFLCLSIVATLFIQCEARVPKQSLKLSHAPRHVNSQRVSTSKNTNKIKIVGHLEMDGPVSALVNTQPYVGSPFTLPPFDSLGPMPMPQNTPPFCEYPPSTPQSPSTLVPTPVSYTSSPPPPTTFISTPIFPIDNPPPSPTSSVPSPPESSPLPNPPEYGPSPPSFAPGSPEYVPTPNPPSTIPGTPEYVPSPPNTPSTTPGTPEYVPSPPNSPSTIPGTPEYVPSPPNTPSTIPGTPDYVPSPPNSPSTVPGAPEYVPSPPNPPSTIPGTPEYVPTPDFSVPSPQGVVPGTPGYGPNPPIYFPGPSGYTPSPTVFQPPVIYPPPSVPPPPYKKPHFALWCVVKPSVPDPIIQEAMNYACGSGADCGSIQQNGSCYKPDTLFAHASYAFNSYWQRTKAAGGTCDFGGTGMLVTVDPSFDGCHFVYY